MTPYVMKLLPLEDVELFYRVRESVVSLPDIDLGTDPDGVEILLSCHMLAKAIAEVFGLTWVSGFFAPHFEHSWVLAPKGSIIDVYPVGMLGGPLLLDGKSYAPSRQHYLKRDLSPWSFGPFFDDSVKKLIEALKTH